MFIQYKRKQKVFYTRYSIPLCGEFEKKLHINYLKEKIKKNCQKHNELQYNKKKS
jgi:hypothetical protein